MKKALIGTSIFLLISIVISSFFLYQKYQDNNKIDKENIKEQEEIDKTLKEKEEKLTNLKEEKKDQIQRFEKIEKWNEEIISYLE